MLDVRNLPGMPRPGDRIAGKYLVGQVIGAGGMGCVLAAEHALLRTRVAIKLLLPQAAALPGAVERFLREAQTAATLRGEHVARVLDVGTTESGAPFLVMEHLSGQDLRTVIRERAPLPVEEAVAYVLQACEAILEAHALGVLHRDIKPANIFVTSRPNGRPLVKVLDFGLAKVLAPAHAASPEESITQTGQVIGSPHYMPPEQFRSLRNADARSDIWALGAVLYEALTGRRPFVGEGMAGVMASVIADTPLRARALRPELHPALDALVMRCLEKPPERRPQWVAELIAELEPFGPRPERSSRVWHDIASPPSEAVTLPLQPRWQASPPPVAPAPAPVPLPEPTLPPLLGRSTLRMAPPPRRSAADDETGMLHAQDRADVTAMSGPIITSVPAQLPPAQQQTQRHDGRQPPAGTPVPGSVLRSARASSGGETATAEDVSDLTQTATTPRPLVGRTTSRSGWIVVASILVLTIGGGLGARALVLASAGEVAGKQGPSAAETAPPAPSAVPDPSVVSEPVAEPIVDPAPASASAAVSAVAQAEVNAPAASPAARPKAAAASAPKATSAAPGPSAEAVFGQPPSQIPTAALPAPKPALSPSSAPKSKPSPSSAATPAASAKDKAPGPPAPTPSDDGLPFRKYD